MRRFGVSRAGSGSLRGVRARDPARLPPLRKGAIVSFNDWVMAATLAAGVAFLATGLRHAWRDWRGR
jgi:hypothetical protein